jgi:hypothetical protein
VGSVLGEYHAPCTLKTSFVDFEIEHVTDNSMAKTKYKRTNNDLQKEIIMKQLTMRNISIEEI